MKPATALKFLAVHVLFGILVSLAITQSSPAQAAPLLASVGVTPSQGLAGSTVTLNGSGYTPNATATIRWDGSDQSSFIMPASGSFSISFTIPHGASPGGHFITVCQGCGQGEFEVSATVGFTVLAPATHTPTSLPQLSSPTPTRTPTITPPPNVCRDTIEFVSPGQYEEIGGAAGLTTTDIVFNVHYSAPAPLSLEVILVESAFYVTHWPDPPAGTTVEHIVSSGDPNLHVFTLRDVPLRFGYIHMTVRLGSDCRGRTGTWNSLRFYNGDIRRGAIHPASCSIGLESDTPPISFESGGTEYITRRAREELGVSFERTMHVVRVDGITTRSGHNAGGSLVGMEFGSAGQAIHMNFADPIEALGMYVGTDAIIDAAGEISAVLNVYGYPADSSSFGLLGSASTAFAAEPTDVLECLTFEAPAGALITAATLDYISAGISIAERRLIDDLTIRFPQEITRPLPEDQPPAVEITRPDGSEIFTGLDIRLFADITEDRELTGAWYQVNGGEEIPLGISHRLGDDPTQYFTGTTVISRSLVYEAPNTLTVIAEDSAGQRGSDSVFLTLATPIPELDLSIYNYEVTQVVQCLDEPECGPNNGIPLFSGKPTLLRVYILATGADGPVSGISGELCFDGGICHPALNTATVDATTDPVDAYRGNLDGTLNFLIPSFFTAAPREDLNLTVTINPEGAVLENNLANNSSGFVIDILPSSPIKVVTIGVLSDGFSPDLPAARSLLIPYFEAVYPTADIRYLTFAGDALIDRNYKFTEESDIGGCNTGWNDLMITLWFKQAFNVYGGTPGPTYWYGIVDEQTPHTYHGCGNTPGYVSGGIVNLGDPHDSNQSGSTIAQEIGHNWGLGHMFGCNAGSPDADMPRGMRVRGPLNLSTGISPLIGHRTDTWGIDLVRTGYPYTIYGPSGFDFMGYCGGSGAESDGVVSDGVWISHYVYKRLIRARYGDIVSRLPGFDLLAAARAQVMPGEYLIGVLEHRGSAAEVREGFYVTDLTPEQQSQLATPVEEGRFTARLSDENGQPISERRLDALVLSNHEHDPDRGLLMVSLPWDPAAARLVVLDGEQIIFEQDVSPNAPQITLLSPNGGETYPTTGTQTISWKASDPDGDELRYQVQYSIDDGQTWTSISAEITNATAMEVDVSRLGGSQQVRVRVLVSDGINTSSDMSDGVFVVPGKAPEISIVSPQDGQTYPAAEAVILNGFAVEFEDRELPDSAYLWSSDIDGDLGSGPSMWGLPLSVGEHTITLTVSDRDGNSSSQSVSIEILDRALQGQSDRAEDQASSGAGGRPPGSLLIGGAIALLGFLVVGGTAGAAYFLMKRRS